MGLVAGTKMWSLQLEFRCKMRVHTRGPMPVPATSPLVCADPYGSHITILPPWFRKESKIVNSWLSLVNRNISQPCSLCSIVGLLIKTVCKGYFFLKVHNTTQNKIIPLLLSFPSELWSAFSLAAEILKKTEKKKAHHLQGLAKYCPFPWSGLGGIFVMSAHLYYAAPGKGEFK